MNIEGFQDMNRTRVLRPFLRTSALPVPRIEVTIARKEGESDVVECNQLLVMGLAEGDGRREQFVQGKFVDVPRTTLHMGGCVRLVQEEQPLIVEATDGRGWMYCDPTLMARAIWDGQELGLPVFLSMDDRCQRIDDGGVEECSREVVYVLLSETESGLGCSLHATRALAEAQFRTAMGEYTRHGTAGAEARFNDQEVERLVKQSRDEEVQPKDLDWYKIELMPIEGTKSRSTTPARAPMSMAFEVYGLVPGADGDDAQEARGIAALTVDPLDRRWICAWQSLWTVARDDKQLQLTGAGSARMSAAQLQGLTDFGLGFGAMGKQACSQGYNDVLVSLRAIPDPSMAGCERVRAISVTNAADEGEPKGGQDLWRWIAAHASFTSTPNRTSQGQEFMVNAAASFDDVPTVLDQIIQTSKADKISWLMFRQGN